MYTLVKENSRYGIRDKGIYIPDITIDKTEAYALLHTLNKYEVSLLHVYDVIEDFWAQL